jgi:hypothetical protein
MLQRATIARHANNKIARINAQFRAEQRQAAKPALIVPRRQRPLKS